MPASGLYMIQLLFKATRKAYVSRNSRPMKFTVLIILNCKNVSKQTLNVKTTNFSVTFLFLLFGVKFFFFFKSLFCSFVVIIVIIVNVFYFLFVCFCFLFLLTETESPTFKIHTNVAKFHVNVHPRNEKPTYHAEALSMAYYNIQPPPRYLLYKLQ